MSVEKLVEVDTKNLRFYAAMFREHQWQTDVLHWSVFVQTLSEIADRYAELRAENERLKVWKDALDDQAVACWVLSESNKDDPRKMLNDIVGWNVQVALDPAVSKTAADWVERIQQLEQRNAELRAAISAFNAKWEAKSVVLDGIDELKAALNVQG